MAPPPLSFVCQFQAEGKERSKEEKACASRVCPFLSGTVTLPWCAPSHWPELYHVTRSGFEGAQERSTSLPEQGQALLIRKKGELAIGLAVLTQRAGGRQNWKTGP